MRNWSSVNGNVITVSDASGFEKDAAVIVRNSLTSEGWGISRIRKITGNQLELYHRLAGVAGTDPNRAVAMLSAGSLSPHALVREPDGRYRLFVTAFQPFILTTGSFGNCELVASLTAASVLGPWQWDHLGSPSVPPDLWNGLRAQENLGIVNVPVNTALGQ